jgi:ADP-heptose:LPS heptosyltransferase
MRFPGATVRRILVVKLSSMGDIVHVTPCLRALRQAFPAAGIVMAVDRRFAALVGHNAHLDEVIEADEGEGRLAAWLEPWRHLAGRRRPRFDLAIDFQGTRRSAAWVYASGARIRAGRRRAARGWRPGWHQVVVAAPRRHAVEVCADVAASVGVRVENLDPELSVPAEAEERLGARLAAAGLPPSGYVLINPFTRWPSKTWPIDRYRELLVELAPMGPWPIVVHAGPGEEQGLQSLADVAGAGGRPATTMPGLPLEEALALFRRARLMVSGDTGPMHCAAALGTPVVALFGPTWPECTGPWGVGHRIIQRSRPPSPHAFRSDAAGRHIRAIDVPTVLRQIREALAGPVGDRPGEIAALAPAGVLSPRKGAE